jgi:phosphate butyryltransferase
MLNTFEQIKEKLVVSGIKKRVLLWHATDQRWLDVLEKLYSENLIETVLVADENRIKTLARVNEIDLSKYEMYFCDSRDCDAKTLKTHLADDRIDILIRGNIGIRDSLKALFFKDVGFRQGKKVISGVSCHYVQEIDRLLILSDPVINPEPDITRKIAIVNNAVTVAHKLGDELPKVAMLAAVEAVYPVMKHTLEGAAIAKMNDRGQIKDCLVDGPLSMDVAVIQSAAKAKGVIGEVAGNANVLIAPNIETAYGMNKAFSRFVGAPTGTTVIGGKVPYCITSRSDTRETKENSLMLSMLL